MLSMFWEASVRALAIALAAGLVLRLARIKARAARFQVWAAVLFSMLLLPALATWGPAIKVTSPVMESVVDGPIALTPPLQPIVQARHASLQANPGLSWDWRRAVVAIYLAGLFVMLLRLMLGTWQALRLLRMAQVVQGKLTHGSCATPLTIGFLRPKVVLPQGWTEWPREQLQLALTHEQEHVRRRDPLFQWVALLNRAVFWFHPLAWWLERHIAGLAEEACDDAVLAEGY